MNDKYEERNRGGLSGKIGRRNQKKEKLRWSEEIEKEGKIRKEKKRRRKEMENEKVEEKRREKRKVMRKREGKIIG